MARRPGELRLRPAPEAVALVGMRLLDAARAAAGRLSDPDDAEALHDFRVALRRLRTLLRSFRDEVGDIVPKKLQRRLRDVARSTGPGRDAEVQLAWIQAHKPELGGSPRPGVPWFIARLEGRRDRAYTSIREDGPPEFRQLERRIRRALNRALTDTTPGRPALAAATGRLLRAHVTELELELETARATRDEAAIHRARIALKRLRYLLEPLQGDGLTEASIIDRLKQLQDLLGELHDLHALAGELGDASADAAAERARRQHDAAVRAPRVTVRRPARPAPGSAGLMALARLAAQWEERLFARLANEWLQDALPALLQDVTRWGETLAVPILVHRPRSKAAPTRRSATRPARAE
ncbi:MAG TPA: CHAD domain-containing protein [Gemmatimonadales bacterium]|nr:CHAD domain-containing protein [Gemmatimonadales bacterium]